MILFVMKTNNILKVIKQEISKAVNHSLILVPCSNNNIIHSYHPHLIATLRKVPTRFLRIHNVSFLKSYVFH
jgi:hypothetical protein